MSTKRQPAKQRRQTQNQRQRAALQARRANAATGGVPDGKVGGGSTAASSGGVGGLFSRLRGSAATGRAIRTGVPEGGGQPVGYRAALSALLAAVAAAVVGALLISIPVDASGEPIATPGALVGEWSLSAYAALQDDPEATADELVEAVDDWSPNGEEPYGKAYFPLSLGLLLPVVGAGLAFRTVSKRAPAKVVNRTMYVTLFGTLLNAQLLFLFLPTVVAVGIAAFQVRKAEVAAAAVAEGAGGEPPDDEVIDVDEVLDDGEVADEAIEAEEAVESDQLIEAEEADEAEVSDDEGQRSV